MRLLHTSDWHLGRSLHRADLRGAQAAWVDHLVEVVRGERIDAVLVSGDVFDRAIPPVDSVLLWDDALARLRAAGARLVVSSGNHDSAVRLGAGARLADAAGVHVRTRVSGLAEPVLLPDVHGEVAVYAIPYLEPEVVRDALPPDPDGPAQAPQGQAGVLGRALACCAADLRDRGGRSVVMAHAWVTGGQPGGSERDLTVGGLGSVPAAPFLGFDYAALGHLHGPQVLADGLRYSGSPLAYSFAEARQRKLSWLVELDASGLTRVEQVPAPVPRRLSQLRGELADLLQSPAYEAVKDDWLSVVLTDAVRPVEAMTRLQARFAHVLVLAHEPQNPPEQDRSYATRVRGLSDLELCTSFVDHVRGGPCCTQERDLLAAALEAARLSGSQA